MAERTETSRPVRRALAAIVVVAMTSAALAAGAETTAAQTGPRVPADVAAMMDESFGVDGLVQPSDDPMRPFSTTVSPDGSLIVASVEKVGYDELVVRVRRLTADGAADPSFAEYTTTRWGLSGGVSTAVDSEGRVLVHVSYVPQLNRTRFELHRLLPDGTLDTTFGIGGVVQLPFSWSSVRWIWRYMKPTPSGAIILFARRIEADSTSNTFKVVRLNEAGDFDTGYGSGGEVEFGPLEHSPLDLGLEVDSDGSAFVVLSGLPFPSWLVKVNPHGELDEQFGDGGILRLEREGVVGPVDGDEAFDPWTVEIVGDRIYVAGGNPWAGPNRGGQVTVRDKTSGERLGGFGPIAATDRIHGLTATSDGSLWAVGQDGAVRLRPDGSPTPGWGTSELVAIHGESHNGGIIATVALGDGFAFDGYALVRLDPPPPLFGTPTGGIGLVFAQDRVPVDGTVVAWVDTGGPPFDPSPGTPPVRYQVVDGPNRGTGGIALSVLGNVTFRYRAHGADGEDTVLVWQDVNRDRILDEDEPSDMGTVRLTDEFVDHIAMGDSFSAGTGVAPQLGSCERSTKAWAWAVHAYAETGYSYSGAIANGAWDPRDSRTAGEFGFVACGGATAIDLIADDGQVDSGLAAVGTPDLVTFSIGGNDFGFSDVIRACLLDDECGGRTPLSGYVQSPQVQGALLRVQDNVTGSVARLREGNADPTIVMVGYPVLIEGSRSDCPSPAVYFPSAASPNPWYDSAPAVNEITPVEQEFVEEGVHWLNSQLAALASDLGVHFVDPTDAFAGHGYCGPDDEWINGIVVDGGNSSAAFHPDARGHEAYAEAVIEHLRSAPQPRNPRTGLPANPAPTAQRQFLTTMASTPDSGVASLELSVPTPISCGPDTAVLDGGTLRIDGTGFPSGASVALDATDRTGTTWPLPGVVADSDGTFTADVTIAPTVDDTGVLLDASFSDGASTARVRTSVIVPSEWSSCTAADTATVPAGSTTTIDVLANDQPPTGGSWDVFGIVDPGAVEVSGELNGSSGLLTITPPPDFEGDLHLEYIVCGRNGYECHTESVTLDVQRACTITGTDGDDVLVGTDGDDVICAGGGNDVIFAGAGDDVVYGDLGHDLIYGGDGDDALYGGPGDDTIDPGPGTNTVVDDYGTNSVGPVTEPAMAYDTDPPSIYVYVPWDGDVYETNDHVDLIYGCDDEGPSGLVACETDASDPLDTSTPGEYVVSFTARDGAGNETVREVRYYVSDGAADDAQASPRAGVNPSEARGGIVNDETRRDAGGFAHGWCSLSALTHLGAGPNGVECSSTIRSVGSALLAASVASHSRPSGADRRVVALASQR